MSNSLFLEKLKPAETRYSTFDWELLAVYLAIKHFHHFVEGRTFHVLTDHKPLTFALSTKSEQHTPRQIHHLDYILQFTSDIRNASGTENAAADALSRIGVNSLNDTSPILDLGEMAIAQRDDTELQSLRSSTWSLVFKEVPLSLSDSTIICDTSTGVQCPFVPSKFSHAVFIHYPTWVSKPLNK